MGSVCMVMYGVSMYGISMYGDVWGQYVWRCMGSVCM